MQIGKPPTKDELQKFWAGYDSSAIYTCHECGKTGQGYWVEPQHPYYMGGVAGLALCSDCINNRIHEANAKRKADLAAMPRCEFCHRRGTWKSYGVLMCGKHLNNVKRAHNRNAMGAGFMGMFMAASYTPECIRQMAKGGELPQ